MKENNEAKKIRLIILFAMAACFLFILIFFSWLVYKKPAPLELKFVVVQGQTTRQIAENLQEQKLINSEYLFLIYAKIRGGLIHAGVYELSSEDGIVGVYNDLTSKKGSQEGLTVPEGWRVTQIDAFFAEKNIIKKGDLIRVASSDEGYLFPDTYNFLPNTEPKEARKIMIENFFFKTSGLKVDRQTLILASIVEREAKFDEDRPKIAGVYINRLEQGMRLEADPTVQYAKGSWEEIKVADYKSVNSAYNTYLHIGLPPGPICNPGLKSIKAVLTPEKDGYLYFFHKSDGHAVFSKTLEEHQEQLKK